MVHIDIRNVDERGVLGKYDALSGNLVLWVAEVDVYTILACKPELGIDMLAGTGIFCLLNDDDLILVHFLSELECRGERCVACRTLLKPFERGKAFGYVEYAALRDRDIPVHVAQGTAGASGDVGTVGVCGKRDAEARVTRRERLFMSQNE